MFTFREMLTSFAPFFTTAVVILLSPFVKEHIPSVVSNYLVSIYQKWISGFSTPQVTVVIEEKDGLLSNQIYEAAIDYLRALLCDSTKPKSFKVSKTVRQTESTFDIVKNVQFVDYFETIRLKWMLRAESKEGRGGNSKKYLELSFDRGSEQDVLDSYLAHVVARFEKIQSDKTGLKLYTRGHTGKYGLIHGSVREEGEEWRYVILEHPATFEKLAMNPEQKKMLKDDLHIFCGRKEHYKKVGKAWKRGYLLYGPPGTGKTSLIAAMANYLQFNIYDLNLSGRYSDDDLRSILLSTTNRSILVIEDIDCGTKFNDRKRKDYSFTLSGLLNVIDGLWTSCGDERIIVFTTNHKDRLDPALLRPGRMDLHVHMSYCTMDGFKLLASNYLNINADHHQLCREIDGLLKNVEVTPAEIAENLLKSGDPDVILGGLVKFLQQKKRQKTKAAKLKELLKSDYYTDDVEGFVKFLEEEKLKNAMAEEAEQLLKSDGTDVDFDADVEGLVQLFKQKKLENAKAADAKSADA